MRPAAAILAGFILISVWSIAIVSESAGWLAWVQGAAGVLAVIGAFGLVRESAAARALLALDAAMLFAGALVALVGHAAPAWSSWSALATAFALVLLSLPRRLFARFSTVRAP